MPTDEEWRKRRTAFSKSFGNRVIKGEHQVKILRSIIEKFMDKLRESEKASKAVNIDELFGQLTVDVICEVGFEYYIGALDNSSSYHDMKENLRVMFENTWLNLIPLSNFLWDMNIDPFRKLSKMRTSQLALWRKVLDNAIEKDSQGLLHPDSLATQLVLLSKQKGIKTDDVLGEIAVLFIAGHETTAHTLSFYIHALCKHQEVQSLNREAVIKALREEDEPYVPGTLPPIVDATLKESMRITPVAPNGISHVSQYTSILS